MTRTWAGLGAGREMCPRPCSIQPLSLSLYDPGQVIEPCGFISAAKERGSLGREGAGEGLGRGIAAVQGCGPRAHTLWVLLVS